jgi:hypothetical protein
VASILWTYAMLKSDKKPESDFEAIIDDCERCEAQGITEKVLNAGLPRKDWVPEGWLKKRKADAVAVRDRLRAQRQQHDGPPPQLNTATTSPVHLSRRSASMRSMFRLIWGPWMRPPVTSRLSRY